MKLLADANVERPVVEALRRRGHDIVRVSDVRPQMEDEEVLAWGAREGRIVVTNDKDFGELVFLRGQAAAGVLLLRLTEPRPAAKAVPVAELVDRLGERLAGAFTVLGDAGARVRRLPSRRRPAEGGKR